MKTFYVDIPTMDCVANTEGAWQLVETFDTKEEAVQFIRDNFGPCDDNGNVCLITEGQDE